MRPPLAGRRVIVTTDAVGGVWRYAVDAASELARREVRVSLLGLGPAPFPAQRDEAAGAGIPLLWLDDRLDWTVPDAAAARALAADLADRAAAEGADVLHLNATALAGAHDFALPTVAVAHSCLATWWRAVRDGPPPADWAWHRRLTARGLRRSAVAVAPSRAFAAALVQAYGPLPSLRVIHNGARAVAPARREPAVLAAGRWWDEAKNVTGLDAAAARIDWPVLAAGADTGPSGDRIETRHLRRLGTLSPFEMAARTARAPIHLSLALYEPFGLSVLEAAAAGAALVLSDIPTFRELWDGVALFVDPTDPDDAASAVNGLIAEPGLRRRLGADAARRAACYTVERQVDGLIDAYTAAILANPLPA